MIKSSKHSTIIYTDHDVSSVIAAAIKLITFSVDKLNMKLIRVFTYLSQFRLDVRYRSEKFNIVSDALSRLFVTKDTSSQEALNVDVDLEHFQSGMNSSENDRIYAYVTTLVEMSDQFRSKIKKKYQRESR
jgi:hypothetical protein